LGTAHTLENFEKAFFMPSIMDFNSFEQWQVEGSKTHDERGRDKARAALAAYEKPKMDEGIAEALAEFVATRERELPNLMN
jgi:trimethylamine---corrinoid protein Co-methyltransferase